MNHVQTRITTPTLIPASDLGEFSGITLGHEDYLRPIHPIAEKLSHARQIGSATATPRFKVPGRLRMTPPMSVWLWHWTRRAAKDVCDTSPCL